MAYRQLPDLQYDALPLHSTITAQGVETHAIHEITVDAVDGKYHILAYDPALQTPEMQDNHEMSDVLTMAALALRATGMEWTRTKEVLGPEVAATNELDERLSSATYAARAIGTCYRKGLLQAYFTEAEHPKGDIFTLSQLETRALTALSKGTISRSDTTTRGTLNHLQARYSNESLLSLLTKATARKFLPVEREPEIRYMHDFVQYDVDRDTVNNPEIADIDLDEIVVSGTGPIDKTKLRTQNYKDPGFENERKKFMEYLAWNGIDTSNLRGPRTVTLKGVTFTFDFPKIPANQSVCLTLHMLGLTDKEIDQIAPTQAGAKRLIYWGKKGLSMPSDTDTTLHCVDKGYITYNMRSRLPALDIPVDNAKLLYQSVIENVPTQDFSDEGKDIDFWRRALRYTYRALGTTNRREAVLLAQTHGMLPLNSTDIHIPTGQETISPEENYQEREAKFERETPKSLEITPDTSEFTINWRGAKVTIDFRGELTGYPAAIAALRFFGVPRKYIKPILPADIDLRAINGTLRDYFKRSGVTDQLFEGFRRGYIRSVDTTDYQPHEVDLETQEQMILRSLDRYTPTEARRQSGMVKSRYDYSLTRIFDKFRVTDYNRLIWAAMLPNTLPANAKFTVARLDTITL
jgi:hypothetical protein